MIFCPMFFAHHGRRRCRLRAGLENMSLFARDNEEELQEGFAVSQLSQEALDSTPEDFIEDPELYGVAVQYDVPFSSRDIAYCNTAVNGAEVYTANYLSYERENLSDLDCFLCANMSHISLSLHHSIKPAIWCGDAQSIHQ